MKTILRVESIWGARIAEMEIDGEIAHATLMVPGLSDAAWGTVHAKLSEYGQPGDSEVAYGPLLRFVVERRES